MTTAGLAPIVFDAPLVNPAPNGLLAVTSWQPQDGPLRWLAGMDVTVFNYGGAGAFGVWNADWCATTDDLGPGDVKTGERPEMPDTFAALTTWAYDECDLTKASQAEVRTRAEQIHRLQEPNAAETAFAARLLGDAGTPGTAGHITAAVAWLEAALARTNTVGVIHAGAQWAAPAAEAGLIVRSGAGFKTPLGNTWVFGGGYVDALDDVLVASSPVFGWRGEVDMREVPVPERNRFAVVAERSMVLGYETVVGAVSVADLVEGLGYPGVTNFPGGGNFPIGG